MEEVVSETAGMRFGVVGAVGTAALALLIPVLYYYYLHMVGCNFCHEFYSVKSEISVFVYMQIHLSRFYRF